MSTPEHDTPVVVSGVEWRVDRIETVPMTAQQHDNAVRALAALIAVWLDTTTRKTPTEMDDRAA